jgi:hypothetical protein
MKMGTLMEVDVYGCVHNFRKQAARRTAQMLKCLSDCELVKQHSPQGF